MLEIVNASKKFKGKKALDDFNYTFENGIYGLLGPNGAGKTTLIRCITQLYNLSSGKIILDGVAVEKSNELHSQIGYLPQKFGMFRELTVYEMMSAMAVLKNVPKNETDSEIRRCVELVNLSDRIDSKVKTLSGGMIKRLGIAQAVINDPKIILLDEPTAGLDPEERLRFKTIVSTLGKTNTVILSTHIVEDVEALCSLVIIMNNGKVLGSGTCAEIEKTAEGKVFEVKKSDESCLLGNYHIQQQFEKNQEVLLRVLSSSEQNPEKALSVNPKVEDGYICLLKNI